MNLLPLSAKEFVPMPTWELLRVFLRVDAECSSKTFPLWGPSSWAWTPRCLPTWLPPSQHSRVGQCPGVMMSFLTTKPPMFVLSPAGTSCWAYHFFFGLLSVFTSSNFEYLKCLSGVPVVFLNSFELLFGLVSFTVLVYFLRFLGILSVWALGYGPDPPYFSSSTWHPLSMALWQCIFTGEINLCNLKLKLSFEVFLLGQSGKLKVVMW